MGQSEQKMGGNNVKWQDVVIKKVFFCMFDTTLEVVPYSGYVPGDEDEMYRYLCQMVAKYYYHETSRKGFIMKNRNFSRFCRRLVISLRLL